MTYYQNDGTITSSATDMPEPKPCPFCGGPAVESRPGDVHCKNGICAGYKTRHMRPEEWNTRADARLTPDDAMARCDAVAELVKAARECCALYRDVEHYNLTAALAPFPKGPD